MPSREQIASMLERLPQDEPYTFSSALMWCGMRDDTHTGGDARAFAVLDVLEEMVCDGLLRKGRRLRPWSKLAETYYWRPNVLELLGDVDASAGEHEA